MTNFDETRSAFRAFGRRALLATTGAAAIGALGAGPTARAAEAAVTDADILNFALNLEYLEAEFYLRAAFGRGLASGDIGGSPGQVVGGRRVHSRRAPFASTPRRSPGDEEAHVKFLRTALGGAAVARPAIDLNDAFTAAARAAGLVGPNKRFDAFASEQNFLLRRSSSRMWA